MLSPDLSSEFSCIDCLRNDILFHLHANVSSDIKYISNQYSIQDLMELLTDVELSKYLDLKLDELLQSEANFIQCPKCESTWEFVHGDIKFDSPDFSRELGIDGKILSNDSQMHYLSHRVCCRTCNKNFCRSCCIIPYHSGFSCDLFQLYLKAKKCRFCATALMPGEIAPEMQPNGTCEALQNVCNSEFCLAKRDLSCRKMLTCDHPCGGTLNEKYCMSCIHEGCQGRKSYMKQLSDDYCNICFTEELFEAPCIELDCGHIFHFECMKKRLQTGNDEPSVNFNHCKCPLCKMFIGHCNLLSEELQKVQSLYRDLEMRAYLQLKEDSLLNAPLIDDKNEFFLNAIGYAMKRYAFYNCHLCKKPYYGGLANCRDIAQGLNSSDFVCPACSGIGMDDCQIHGRDYMLYKCKFCCSVATYFCWGSTHFCLSCHKRQENHDFMTTKMKKDLDVCKGKDGCPLKVEHPPNGEEFSLGCSLCRGTDNFITHKTSPPLESGGNNERNADFNEEQPNNQQ